MSASPDPSLLVLDSDNEAFFKATTPISDVQELREHILTVAAEAYEVSSKCNIRVKRWTAVAGVSI